MTSSLEKLLINERGVALNPVTGETFRLVGPAPHLVRLLQGGADHDALLRFLLGRYDVDETTARRDLDAFLASLEQLHWTEVQS